MAVELPPKIIIFLEGQCTMIGLGFAEIVIIVIVGLMLLAVVGGIVAAVVIAASSRGRERD